VPRDWHTGDGPLSFNHEFPSCDTSNDTLTIAHALTHGSWASEAISASCMMSAIGTIQTNRF